MEDNDMKKTLIILTAIAALSLSSCGKMNPTDAGEPAIRRTVRLSAATSQHTTKTSLGENDLVLWNEGDKIGVFGTEALSAPESYSLVKGMGGTTGQFEGLEVKGDSLIAIYPFSCIGDKGISTPTGTDFEVGITIPSTYTYAAGSFPEESNIAVGVGDSTRLTFNNVMGVLELKLYATSTRSVKRIQIAAAEPLAGSATLSFKRNGSKPTLKFGADSSKVITLEFTEAIKLSTDKENPTPIYVNVPAGALAKGLTVSIANANADPLYALVRTIKDNTISRSGILEMPAVEVAPTFKKSELANTIIVEPKCTTYINYLRPDGELPGHMAKMSVVAISSAVSNVSTQGTVAFLTNYKARYIAAEEGNTIIAASNGREIVWSWSMWTTDTPKDVTLSDGSIIMDRNLGATATCASDITSKIAETQGRMYQWGRKDWCCNVSTNKVESSATTGTVKYVTENPTKFITTSAGCAYTGDWNYAGDDTLWGAEKTIYDPCPAGYKVPMGTGSKAIWTACDFASNKGTFDSTNYGYNFAVGENGATLWFPRFSYYNTDGSQNAGGYYWNYDTVPMNSGAHYARLFKFTSTAVTNSSNSQRGFGCAIRCIKITE